MNIIYQKPLLAKTKFILKNLKKIDKNRYYSNYGPLYFTIKKKIETKYKLNKFSVTLTSSGHSAIQACCNLIANKYSNKKKLILVPSFSFVSDIQSIIQSGLEPYFVDIDPETLEMDYEKALKALNLKRFKNKFAAILICSPFGYPICIEKIIDLFKKYKIKIIYDAADAIINTSKIIENKQIFYTFSFHPTKNLPSNESGMIITSKKNEGPLMAILNFGINLKDRVIKYSGFNGKFSEYDAAILIANFLLYRERKIKIRRISMYLSSRIRNKNLIKQKNYGKNWFSLKFILRHKIQSYNQIYKIFKKNNISIFKPWSEKLMSDYQIFKKFNRSSLKISKSTQKKIFALPIYYDMSKKEMDNMIAIANKI